MKKLLTNTGDILHIAWYIGWRTTAFLAGVIGFFWLLPGE